MEFQLSFKTSKNIDQLNTETIQYFTSQNFRLIRKEKSKLIFERGSSLMNMITFNPLKWKSLITITFNDVNVESHFKVNTTGQVVTRKEKLLWETFVTNYQKTLKSTYAINLKQENKKVLKSTLFNSLGYIKHIFIGAILFGIPSGFIAYLTDLPSIVAIGASTGGMIFLNRKITQDKLK